MNYLYPQFRVWLFLIAMVTFVACGDDNDDRPMVESENALSLTATTTNFERGRGTTVNVPVSVLADAGIKSVTVSVDGAAAETLSTTAGTTTENVSYDFTIPASSLFNTEYQLAFVVTDADDKTATSEVFVNTGALIEIPSTYDFLRDGSTTVSYAGQNERLDMVALIKSEILAEGDKGNRVSEMALLNAFNNADGNGGGLFPFESSKQLADKTFQVDLDNRLFENLFAAAEVASVAGVKAANGTAGLIIRESKGSTILVDENGREFTQLIEKGLMGAVMYNQIYNTYFTEARIGNDVENTALREGSNYTDMEHHWDEAFGYWNPPLDFSSNWPAERASEDRFWSHYSNTVDPHLGTNSIIMDAFVAGRAAIVNNDLDTKDAQRAIISENLELVSAGTAVHYINDSLEALNEGDTGEAFHVMSEVWTFVNALKYNAARRISLDQIDEILGQDLGANGNFWNVTPEGLNKAKATLVSVYPELDPVQDNL